MRSIRYGAHIFNRNSSRDDYNMPVPLFLKVAHDFIMKLQLLRLEVAPTVALGEQVCRTWSRFSSSLVVL